MSISSEQNFFWENSSLLFWLNIFCKKMMDTLLMCPFSKRLADIFPGLRFLWSSFNCCGLGKCNFQLVKVFITWSQGCRVLHHPAPDWIKNYMKFNKQLLSLMMLKLWETDSSEDSTSSCLAFSLPTSPSSWLRSSTVSASGGGILLKMKSNRIPTKSWPVFLDSLLPPPSLLPPASRHLHCQVASYPCTCLASSANVQGLLIRDRPTCIRLPMWY